MASDGDPTYPESRPTGNPHPKRGQIKRMIAEDFVSSFTSMAGRGRWREEPEERVGRDGSSAAGLSQSEENPIGGRWREEPEDREDRDGNSAAGLSQSEENPIGGRWREEPEDREDRDGSSAAGLSQSEENPISEP